MRPHGWALFFARSVSKNLRLLHFQPMRRYLSALKARQADITSGRTLTVLVASILLVVAGFVALAFFDW